MRHALVVAHRTLRSDELRDTMRDRLADGPVTFHLVVPEDHHGSGLVWNEGSARADAARHLEDARLAFLADGIQVTGEVGVGGPVDAVRNALRRDRHVDEVIVSTLPVHLSKWIGLDVPSRLRRSTSLPVTHVVSSSAVVHATS